MRSSALFVSLALSSAASFAQSVHLKCDVDSVNGGPRNERWVEIDQTHNLLRDGGVSMPLVSTVDVYGGITSPVAGFRTKYEINRSTGEILITEYKNRTVAWELKGTCDKAEPPKRKF
ncbi:hypothetical protein [Comamonas sp. E6]|uniref:hypothetical protein n=1 Tax=Comamonas sp. E6 TaxID=364029 RepID=UPI000631D5A3|nr:hypothetical protein [Comamonas sp. E6]GAO71783.1 hypothetical protein CSE6_017_32200 [Comamonas sp. E6]